MDDEDDDLYGPADGAASAPTTTAAADKPVKRDADASSGDEPMDEGLESADDDADSSDSDSDLEIIIDKPATAAKPAAATPTAPESKAIKIEQPPPTVSTSTPTLPSKTPAGTVPQFSDQSGTGFPAQRTSNIDVNADPVYPPLGKPLMQVDMVADFAEEQLIWRRPGQDQSDYFNYGFDEFTWEMYRGRQMHMAQALQQQKNDMTAMQHMMQTGMPGMPAMPTMPGPNPPPNAPSGPSAGPNNPQAMGPMGGMPPDAMNESQMQMLMQQMASSGMDPSQMDFGTFMQMAGQGMGGGFGGPPQQQSGGFQQGNQGGGGRGGRGGRGRAW
jgi:pre-mRNA 3'-end-processing factor FIP1